MKKIILLLVAAFSFTFLSAQNIYWTVYTMNVDGGQEANFMNTMDRFFESEVGKTMPTAIVRGMMFQNSKSDVSHQVIFSTTDKSQFGKMYSGKLNSHAEFRLLSSKLNQMSESVASYLGKSIIFTSRPDNVFTINIELDVSNPSEYAAGFQTLSDEVEKMWEGKVGMDLHQVLSGNEPNVTHVAVISAPDFETLLDFSDKIYTSPAFAKFAASVGNLRELISNRTTLVLKRYNVPE